MLNSPKEKPPGQRQAISIVLVDDHQVVRQGTREMLHQDSRFEVIGELSTGEDLAGFLALKQPDLLLLDIHLPNTTGLALLEKIREQFPQTKIVLFSAFCEAQYLNRAVQLKADGYLCKTIDAPTLHQAIETVMQQGGPVFSEDAKKMLASAQHSALPMLSPREREILVEVTQGQTNGGIAKKLCLSVKTVDSHVASLMKKLGVNRRTQLATWAIEQGYL